MIHYLKNDEKYRSKILWEEAFPEDSFRFREYYYEEKTRDNRILAAESEGCIVSMLHRNPYEIIAGGCLWKCDYLVGVATSKDSIRKGYMRKLMDRALSDMREEHMPFCFLMPAFKELYLPFGFAYIFRKQEWELNEKGCADLQKKPFKDEDAEKAACWMNQWLGRNYEVYALRSKNYLERLKKELESEAGYLELLYDGPKLSGIRAEWGLAEREQRMLLCPPSYRRNKGLSRPYMMGRIVDLPEFVKAIRLRTDAEEEELIVILQVQDRQLRENQGIWRWHLDKTGSSVEKISEEESGKVPDLVLDISELTAWLTGYSMPEAVGRYAEKIRVLKGVFLDEIV